MVDGFDPDTLDSTTPYAVTVIVNGVENTNPITVEILPEKQSGFSVSPTSASPVLSTILTVSLEDTYPEELLVEDFTARLVDQLNSTITRPLYVMSVDDSTKEIRIKFPGAESGNYYVQIESASIGRIDKTPLSLEVIGKITGISPTYGSIHGGTLVTIDGVNFSDDPLDNPVKVGDNYCLVETTSATQITCRIVETGYTESVQGEVIVFLRVSEEAQSDVDQLFTYAQPLESLSTVSNAFDDATNRIIVTASGTGFPAGDITGTTLYLDGILQETLDVTDSEATFAVTDALDSVTSNARFYFADGLPTNFDTKSFIEMEPSLVSISPSTGSSGGTLITVTGAGFGVNTIGLNLAIYGDSDTICEEVTITGYGSFTCLTKEMQISASDTIVLQT